MKEAPCKGCEKRIIGCHGNCEVYKAFRSKLDEKNEKIREIKRNENCFTRARNRYRNGYQY